MLELRDVVNTANQYRWFHFVLMLGLVLKGFNGFYNTVDIVWRNLSGNKILSQKLHKKQFAQVMDHALMFLI